MNIDDETLLLLLSGGHISISDRKELGIWPHPPILFNDLVSLLVRILEKQDYFPRQWEKYAEGDVIYEGLIILKEGENTYKIRCRRHHPTNPMILAEESEINFDDPKDACDYYLRHDLFLPGNLDGWVVIEQ